MAMTEDQYVAMKLALLPEGDAWPRDPDSYWGLYFRAQAPEAMRRQAWIDRFLAELSVETTELLFDRYEQEYGLPAACITTPQTVDQRRRALVVKENSDGDHNKQLFIDTAAALGYTITITEYSSDHPGPQGSYNGRPLEGDDWNVVWQINAAQTTVQRRRYGSRYGERYATWGNELLECTLKNLDHAHRILFISYS